jgi:hypothetical protein
MNIQIILGILSSIIFTVAISWYVYDVAKGRVRVAVASVAMLVLINVSQLGALIAKELWSVVPFTLIASVMNLLIIIFGIKNGKFQIKKLDIIVFIGALVGLIAWHLTGDPAVNIYILTATMLVSIVPIVSKTFKDPKSETALPWYINFVAAALLLGTITSTEPAAWLVQARQFTFAILMAVGVSLPPKK